MNINLNYIIKSLSSQQLYNCWMHQPTYRRLVSSQQLYNCLMHQPTYRRLVSSQQLYNCWMHQPTYRRLVPNFSESGYNRQSSCIYL